jgi:NAD(P)H dehydrogenase (quinone)
MSHVFIVYAHPSEDSFTREVRDAFIRGLADAGHTYEISDLYKMGFKSEISEEEYQRESNYREDLPLESDVRAEQQKINRCDALVFIYPVFWTEAPAILVGWFDRVWTYGFAYGNRTMKKLNKALILCITGHTKENLAKFGHLASMRTVMIGDRLFDRVASAEMIVFDGMTKFDNELRISNREGHLKKAFELGKNI